MGFEEHMAAKIFTSWSLTITPTPIAFLDLSIVVSQLTFITPQGGQSISNLLCLDFAQHSLSLFVTLHEIPPHTPIHFSLDG
jgi:hypothetical protein